MSWPHRARRAVAPVRRPAPVMLPVSWQVGWPLILPPNTPVSMIAKKPNLPAGESAAAPANGNISFMENFVLRKFLIRKIWLHAGLACAVPPRSGMSTFPPQRRCYLDRDDLFSGRGNPSFLAIRQQNNQFSCSVSLNAQDKTSDCIAGLAVFRNEGALYQSAEELESSIFSADRDRAGEPTA